MIDLDANATTALDPRVLEAMMPWFTENHANASGSYSTAKLARKAIDQARAQVAELVGADPEEIVFTGSGTESVNTALHSLHQLTGEGAAVVSAIEHSAVLKWVDAQERMVNLVGVNPGGRVDLAKFSEACDGAAYASVMAANNETGVIQPIAELSEIARSKNLPFHTDATQIFGKVDFSVKDTPVDMLSLSAHKFHGPKGIGALFVRRGLEFTSFLKGGGQDKGRRSSTENVPAIVGMGEAARLAKEFIDQGGTQSMRTLRAFFESQCLEGIDRAALNGDSVHRLPNTSHFSFDGCDASGMLILLNNAGVACSAGSACMTGKQAPSHVQLAMGVSPARAKTSLRFSFSKTTDQKELETAVGKIGKAVNKLRSIQNTQVGPVVVYGR